MSIFCVLVEKQMCRQCSVKTIQCQSSLSLAAMATAIQVAIIKSSFIQTG